MLTCNVIKDLLPSYIDGLVSEKTAQEIEAHLSECADCKNVHMQMKSPLNLGIVKNEKEIDFLKKIKEKSKLRIVKYSIGSAIVALIIFTLFTWFYTIGTPVQSKDLQIRAYNTSEPGLIYVEMTLDNNMALSVDTKTVQSEITGLTNEIVFSPRQIPKLFKRDSQFIFGFSPEHELSEDVAILFRFFDEEILYTFDDFITQYLTQ
jgi:hypothetical protein